MRIISAPKMSELGCPHCITDSLELRGEGGIVIPPGYVSLPGWDDNGIYYFLGRCYYCNHRDRNGKGK